MRWQALAVVPLLSLGACGAPSAGGAARFPQRVDVDVGPPVGATPEASSAIVATAPTAGSAVEAAPQPIEFIAWDDSVATRARAAKRPVLLVVCAAWAARCASLDRDVLTSADVRRMARAFIAARFDATDTSPAMDVRLRALDVRGFPAILLIDATDGTRESLSAEISASELATRLDAFSGRE